MPSVPLGSGFAVVPISALDEPLWACAVETVGPPTLPHEVHGESDPVSKPGLLTTLLVASILTVSGCAGTPGVVETGATAVYPLPEQQVSNADSAIAASKR
jgi:hypothetical protein